MNFEELKLAPAIVKAVREQGYETPTAIQAQAIPLVLEGHDLLGGAQTGTGKTAAFVLPMLHKLSMARSAQNKFGGTGIRALVLTPTRELAAQVEESVQTYGKFLWWPHQVVCSTCCNKVCSTWGRCRSSCSTRPIACSTWDSSMM